MQIDTGSIVALFLLMAITVPSAVVAAFVYKGNYYKSIAKRVTELEDKDTKSYAEIQRLRTENNILAEQVTNKTEIERLVNVIASHDTEAARRHTNIIGKLNNLEDVMERRARDGNGNGH